MRKAPKENAEHKREQLPHLRKLVRHQRWAALATIGSDGEPQSSMVAYAFDEECGDIYLHLSSLAEHTRNLAKEPRASMAISVNDDGRPDPQELARTTLSGTITPILPEMKCYQNAREVYLARLPEAKPRFDFGDFRLYRLRIDKVRFVGGFARAFSYRGDELLEP